MKEVIFLRILVLLFVLPRSSHQKILHPEDAFVTLSLGKIKGNILSTQYGKDFYAFRGIPYAEPPVGQLRFAPPQPKKPWMNILNATADSLNCPQPGNLTLMSEDCLTINVYSRDLSGKYPVMVYIHGGGNVVGGGHSLYDAGPQYLLDHNVVFVSFNYRLGALGFLSTRTAEARGNFGYLDQVLALKWVQDHIKQFGGDPKRVTIFGQSAGSMAVTLHMVSPLSKGLFHRAIAMSGSATNHYAIDNLHWTRQLAREVSCPMYRPQDVVDCLRLVPWETIVNVCSKWNPYGVINMKWNFEIDHHFLHYHPTEYFSKNNFTKVPLIVGLTKDEMDFTVYIQENNTRLLDDVSLNFHLYAPEFFQYNASLETSKMVSKRLWSHYLGNKTTITKDNMEDFGRIFSDTIIGHGIHRLLKSIQTFQDVYFYVNEYEGQRSLYRKPNGKPRGVGHADDIQYILPSVRYGSQFKIDDPDMFMVDLITKMFTKFAKTGVPEWDDGDVEWKPTTKDSIKAFYIDKDPHMGKEPYREEYVLLDELFPRNFATTMSPSILLMIVVLLTSFYI